MSGARAANRWILDLEGGDRGAVALRLLCFHHAGGGASAWGALARRLPREIGLCAVQLPGRENRLREAPCTRVAQIVAGLLDGLAPVLAEGPFALLGHSFGALVAFELARSLQALRGPLPCRLLVAAHGAPDSPGRGPRIHEQPDAAFVAELVRLGGTPSEVIASREMVELLVPPMRADYTASETYVHEPGSPLAIPISALAGRSDPDVGLAEIEAWRRHTRAGFDATLVDGDHFFLHRDPDATSALVSSCLEPELRRPAGLAW